MYYSHVFIAIPKVVYEPVAHRSHLFSCTQMEPETTSLVDSSLADE